MYKAPKMKQLLKGVVFSNSKGVHSTASTVMNEMKMQYVEWKDMQFSELGILIDIDAIYSMKAAKSPRFLVG